ncbi:FAD:protein FMN transferase [Oenococcus sp. UCMA 17063]|nr:FAD:protein FMN transferase [Oenococcus sp. UCMA 17063]
MTIDLKKAFQQKSFHALGTSIKLTIFTDIAPDVLSKTERLIETYEDQLTVNRDQSEIMAINQAAGKGAVRVCSSSYQLVKTAVQVSHQQMGFNVAIGPLVKLWKIGFTGANVPSKSVIKAKMPLIDPKNIVLDDDNLTVFLLKSCMELDLGAIAKGYIADRVADLWQTLKITSGIIDLGGNLLFIGKSPFHTDQKWRIGVQDPNQARGQAITKVVLPACSAVTSGIYERHLDVSGQHYHHILDSRTGYPLKTKLMSVTVFTKSSLVGEIESTRLFFAGQAINDWQKGRTDLYGAVFVYQNGRIIRVGFKQ